MELSAEEIKLRYPVGGYEYTPETDDPRVVIYMNEIKSFPELLKNAISGLSEEQIDTPYRPGGWTVRQLVHHCADSHMNAFIRFKLALTEDIPVIKPYEEAEWAKGEDYKLPVEYSVAVIDNLHKRWGVLLDSLSPADLERRYFHPGHNREFTVKEAVCHYAWHARHHLAHITSMRKRNGW